MARQNKSRRSIAIARRHPAQENSALIVALSALALGVIGIALSAI